MIRYRRLNESENSDIRLYDMIEYDSYIWFVIGMEGDIVTLLSAKDAAFGCRNIEFGKSIFDKKSNDYRTSEIRKYLNSDILPKLRNANPIPTRLNDVGVTDKVWLLSVEEAKKLPEKIRRFKRYWWLRSPGNSSDDAAYTESDGSVYAFGRFIYGFGYVRPAIRVHIDDLQ